MAVRPDDLPAAATVNPATALIVDDGNSVRKATPLGVVDAAIPLATQAEAEAGTDNAKRVTPLRVKQAIDALGFSGADLASTDPGKGAAMVGAKRGTTARSVLDFIEEMPLTPVNFGAVPNSGDQQSMLQEWLDSDDYDLYLPAGVWRCDGDLIRTKDCRIGGPGIIDFSNGSGNIQFNGSMEQIDSLSSDIPKQGKTLTWATAQSLAPGDVVILWNPTDYSFGGRRPYYRDGGMFQVATVSGSTANCYDLAVDAYTAADMNVYKVSPIRVVIDGLNIIPSATAEKSSVDISFGVDVEIMGLRSLPGGAYGGLSMDRCYNFIVDAATPRNNSPVSTNEYGITILSCQNGTIKGSSSFATRHSVTFGGGGAEGQGPSRFIDVCDMKLFNAPPTGGTGAGDVHGIGDYISYRGCTMQGFSGGGRNIRVIGCTIFGYNNTSGMCVELPETNGGFFDFFDCEFISEGDGYSDTQGYFLIRALGPNWDNEDPDAWVREDIFLRIKNCRFNTPNAVSGAKMVHVAAQNSNVKVNVEMEGCEWVAPDGLTFLYARDTKQTDLPSDYLIVDNVRGPDGSYIIYPDSSVANVPTREMAQRGYVDTACVSGNMTATSSAQSYRYQYSRLPTRSSATHSSITGAAKALYGGQYLNTFINTLTDSLCVVRSASTDSTFAANDDVRQYWEVGVDQV